MTHSETIPSAVEAPSPRRLMRERSVNLRRIEQARARLPRRDWTLPRPFLVDATSASFRIDGIPVTVEQVTRALGHRQSVRAFRSPLSNRLRAHAATLRCIERILAADEPLRPSHLYRWYAGLSAGLGAGFIDDAGRAAEVTARANLPTTRLATALADVLQLYAEMMSRPIVPSYNGIVARLVMNLHLGRCGLLPVIVEPAEDAFAHGRLDEATLLNLLARRYELAGVL